VYRTNTGSKNLGEHAGYAGLNTSLYGAAQVDAYAQGREFSWDDESKLAEVGSTAAGRPLRVIHVGQCLVRAGIESWLKGFIRYLSPSRGRFLRCVVTSDFMDSSVIPEMRIPVEIGGRSSVQRAARDCDVMLVSGPAEVGQWLDGVRPPLSIFIAHGDGPWTRNILDSSRPAFDHAVAVSRRVASLVCNDFPTTVIYNGIDASHISRSRSRLEVRESLGFQTDDFVLGYVGRFSTEKNPDVIIDAVARLPRHFKALFVGWGALRNQLTDLANRRIPGRYAFVQAREHLGDYYAAMDSVCLASKSEGFGLTLLEAMMSERPIISGPAGFAPELLQDRVHGLMVNGDAASVAEAAQLLESQPEWAATVARQGRTLAESFGFARRMCRQYEDLFDTLWSAKFGSKEAQVN